MIGPGRELDVLVAEKLMGWTWKFSDGPAGRYLACPDSDPERQSWCVSWEEKLPEYSTDISAAWEIMEKMYETWETKLTMDMRADNFKSYGCYFAKCEGGFYMGSHLSYSKKYNPQTNTWENEKCLYHRNSIVDTPVPQISSYSMPHAICLAALKAIGYEKETT